MWGTQVGSPDEIDDVERVLLKKGFVRVAGDTAPEEMRAKQYRIHLGRSPLLERLRIEHSILWRE